MDLQSELIFNLAADFEDNQLPELLEKAEVKFRDDFEQIELPKLLEKAAQDYRDLFKDELKELVNT
jgi:hypothetical protein